LTDGSGYELGETDAQVPVPDAPVWLVHLSGDLPLGYDDKTLNAVQASGGGVSGDLEDALERLSMRLDVADRQASDASGTAIVRDLVDGYDWLVLPTDQAEILTAELGSLQTHSPSDPFAALAIRRYILAEMQRFRGSIDDLETLDYLHALALDYGIVSPYSSMIVLVDSQQQRLLEQLSGLEDRYQREVEALSETTPASPLPLTGVPEPHEWLLLALTAGMLAYIAYKKYSPAWAFRLNRQ
jgi:putative PEP-CTERM system integral membrane protein